MNNKKTMYGFINITPIDEALKIIYSFSDLVKPSSFEIVNIKDAIERINFETILADKDLPEFNRSVVDGFALNYEYTLSASASNPLEFNLNSRIEQDNDAIEIYTGNEVPVNTNAVVMAEDVEIDDKKIKVLKPLRKFENISLKGEDFKKGDVILNANKIIKPYHIAALAAIGIQSLKVYSKLKVGVLVTGTELTGKEPKVRNSTGPFILSLLYKQYIECLDLGIVEDDLELIKNRIWESLGTVDILITTGGTSLGRKDFVPEALDSLGKVYFNGVNSRPGKTAGFAVVADKPVFLVSGFPVAAMVSFDVFIWPFIKKVLRIDDYTPSIINGYMTRKVANPSGVRSYLRVYVYLKDGMYRVEPMRITGSGILSSLTKANGMVIIPEKKEGIEENELVAVQMFDKVGEKI
ncbi:MAG: molybdopterin molybdotransferase MoeA [Thermoplasmata archaeon]